ncbi:HesA/MoeB/ThiF family protein [Candidatus Bathyarchaeota archaeon]|nr:HesA/MoeB/ThiF family protein [Candidatus Bathyarchaeota archaeon]
MEDADRLSNEELELYSRQIVLDEIGYEGQLRLRRSRVLLAGAGGLGSPIALQLTAMGVGYLRIVDRDVVSTSDLHRQYLYDAGSIGLPKVEVAASKLSALNPRVKVDPVPVSIKSWNVNDLVRGMEVVIDGLDSIEARYLINRACVKEKIPYVYGGAVETHGNVSTIIPGETPCLECFNPNLRDEDLPKCAVVGVYTPVLGITASVETSEAVRILTGKKPRLAGRLLYINASEMSFDEVSIAKYEGCPVCGSSTIGPTPLGEELIEEQCSRNGKRTIIITPKMWLDVDLDEASNRLKELGYFTEKRGRFGVTSKNGEGMVVSLLKTGVAIFQIPKAGEPSKMRGEAVPLYRELIVKELGMPADAVPHPH